MHLKKPVIGIEAQRLFRAKKHGMDYVALEIIQQLQYLDLENEYIIFVADGPDSDCLQETANFKIVVLSNPFGFIAWEQFTLPKAAKEYGCDLLHCTSNTAPLFCAVPVVTTVHDIIYLENNYLWNTEASVYQRLGNFYRKLLVPMVLKRSAHITTVSNTERDLMTTRFPEISNKISVVYNGVSNFFTAYDILANNYKEHWLPKNYVLFNASTDSRKNTIRVLQAYATAIQHFKENPPKLVLLNMSEKRLKVLLKKCDIEAVYTNVFCKPYVTRETLREVYDRARCFLFPSLREGFGLPILEAFALKTPVITAAISCLPEVAGYKNGYFVNPYSVEAIAATLVSVCTANELGYDLDAAKAHAMQFSWESSAKKTLEVYGKVLTAVSSKNQKMYQNA
mgnify:CR=1 FL=1